VVLRRLRLERDMSQEALAFASAVTVSTLSRIERGESSPTWSTLVQIAHALDMAPAALVAAIEDAIELPSPEG
jgi:transcriptional regulator with XRE-family HTH domain